MGVPRRPYGPRSHYGGGPRQVFHDPRFSQSHMHLQEIHGQGMLQTSLLLSLICIAHVQARVSCNEGKFENNSP